MNVAAYIPVHHMRAQQSFLVITSLQKGIEAALVCFIHASVKLLKAHVIKGVFGQNRDCLAGYALAPPCLITDEQAYSS